MIRQLKRALLLVFSIVVTGFFLVSCSANRTASQTMLVFDSQATPTVATAESNGTGSGITGSQSSSNQTTLSSSKSPSKSKPSASSSSTSTSPSRQTGSSSGGAKASSSGSTSSGHSSKSSQPGQSSAAVASSSSRASSADAPSQPPIEQENPIREINEEIGRITNAQSFEVKIENNFDGLSSFVQQGYAKYAVTNGIGRYYVELHRGNTVDYTYCDGTQLCLATRVGLSPIFPQNFAAEPADKHLMLIMPQLQGSESCHITPTPDGCETMSVEIPDNLLSDYRGVFMIVNPKLPDSPSNKISSLKMEFTFSPQGSLIDLKQHFELDYLGSPLTLDLDRQFEGINQTIVNKPDFL